MNILTQDIISVIATRNFTVISSMTLWQWTAVRCMDQYRNFHRINGPAIIYANNTWMWFFHGQIHRDQTPAVSTCYSYIWFSMGTCIAKREK